MKTKKDIKIEGVKLKADKNGSLLEISLSNGQEIQHYIGNFQALSWAAKLFRARTEGKSNENGKIHEAEKVLISRCSERMTQNGGHSVSLSLNIFAYCDDPNGHISISWHMTEYYGSENRTSSGMNNIEDCFDQTPIISEANFRKQLADEKRREAERIEHPPGGVSPL